MTPTTQLQTLRASTARDLATWREMLAFYRKRGDSHGVAVATLSIYQVGIVLCDIDGLLGDVEAKDKQ